MSAAFLQAALPEPFRVLGRELKPFCLGHVVLLERFESAYAVGSTRPPEIDDLIFSVWICSKTYEEAEQSLHTGKTLREIKKWGKACRRGLDILNSLRTFQRYINEHTELPRFWIEKEGQSFTRQRHWAEGIIEMLMGEFHMPMSQAFNLALPMANRLHIARLEAHGVIRLWTDADFAAAEDSERNRKLMERAEAMLRGGAPCS